jgi:hypothetical protein
VIYYCTRLWVINLSILVQDKLSLNSLVDHYESKFAGFSYTFRRNTILDLLYFILHYNSFLALTYTITVENKLLRIYVIDFLKCFEDFSHKNAQISSYLIIFMLLKRGLGHILATSLVYRSTQGKHRLLATLMMHIIPDNHCWLIKEWSIFDSPRNTTNLCIYLY